MCSSPPVLLIGLEMAIDRPLLRAPNVRRRGGRLRLQRVDGGQSKGWGVRSLRSSSCSVEEDGEGVRTGVIVVLFRRVGGAGGFSFSWN